jgi:hypothetical protein
MGSFRWSVPKAMPIQPAALKNVDRVSKRGSPNQAPISSAEGAALTTRPLVRVWLP